MKRIVLLAFALVLALPQSNAQLNKLAQKAAKGLINNAISQAADKAGLNQGQNQQSQSQNQTGAKDRNFGSSQSSDEKPLTPEEIMASMPALPTAAQIAEYEVLKHNNASAFKIMLNPTATFQTQLALALAAGGSSMYTELASDANLAAYGPIGDMLAAYDLTMEQYSAMSEEEQEALANRFANDQLRAAGINYTTDQLENLSEAEQEVVARQMQAYQYNYMMAKAEESSKLFETPEGKRWNEIHDLYEAVSSEIDSLYDVVSEQCRALWEAKYAARGTNGYEAYMKEAAAMHLNMVKTAMNMRQTKQMPIAKQLNEVGRSFAKKFPAGASSAIVVRTNYEVACAVAYLNEGMKVIDTYKPDFE